jgi:hypothetical protein
MDPLNRFQTVTGFRLARLEWFAALVVCVVLALTHLDGIRWAVFAGLFLYIDVIGYIPGAIAYRRSPNGQVPRGFYVAYNVMHNLVSGAVVVGLWALFVRPEWALLAVPIHLLGDRALFGNTFKAFGVAFEPKVHPAFAAFERAYATDAGTPDATEPAAATAVAVASRS